ncbi:MAG: hypothetical protein HOG03_22135 [Desulfobacula sp.]|jgi:hypothetical protein|uniref:hypothetical protein n=1 Tax=Desulfobacula sp. TaxID=2593537 RepID=UPI001DB74484|nr:hypothetical protein [Desulfobacula sp.]MBT6338421.1 hypothetical protein [Desulfobacula sp.]MBT6751742.1 hypothetical protein [Desulfobacula sp.]
MNTPKTYLKNGIERIKNRIIDIWQVADEVARDKAVGTIEAELEELEYIFAVLVQGTFIGMPSPPVQICMDLLPLMEKDLILLLERVDTANEPLSRLFSVFDIG